ncbi:MAG: hypothetical protein DRQ48_10890 [Gammaproteobacteria bacterium]|nr:MAG: hypothetical protein DRQ48_10890 [Gammaproteobacteria bacterium]
MEVVEGFLLHGIHRRRGDPAVVQGLHGAVPIGAGATGPGLALTQAAADGAQVTGGLAVGQRVPMGGGDGGHGRVLGSGPQGQTSTPMVVAPMPGRVPGGLMLRRRFGTISVYPVPAIFLQCG